jgi:hypothetical protein
MVQVEKVDGLHLICHFTVVVLLLVLSNTEVPSSNSARGMDVLRVFLRCVILCGHRLCDGPIPRPRIPNKCLKDSNERTP